MDGRKKEVAYYFDEDIGNFYYGEAHPMKPHRIRMAHSLIINYRLFKKMKIYRPYYLKDIEMCSFHSDDYIHFLQSVTPENSKEYERELKLFFRNDEHSDCPVFDGLFQFCQLYSGGSVGGAYKLNTGAADIVINWAGGLHHAKKAEAAGFCYVNDIVLAILELLKQHARVLYVDIDIHHGDGVEEAFYLTDRVMTLSFHKGGDFFPGTGDLGDTGLYKGKGYSLNFPLNNGINDSSYESVFEPIVDKVIEYYQPGAIVLQCGADSLAGDRLGCFNLSFKGHGKCVEKMKSYNLPLIILGGGGYTIRNVARCWAYETGICCGIDLGNNIPYNEYYDHYCPDFKLHVPVCNMKNDNSFKYLESTKQELFQILDTLPHAPSVQYHTPQPSLMATLAEHRVSEPDPDIRLTQQDMDERVEPEEEFYDDDKDQDRQPPPRDSHARTMASSNSLLMMKRSPAKTHSPTPAIRLSQASTSQSSTSSRMLPTTAPPRLNVVRHQPDPSPHQSNLRRQPIPTQLQPLASQSSSDMLPSTSAQTSSSHISSSSSAPILTHTSSQLRSAVPSARKVHDVVLSCDSSLSSAEAVVNGVKKPNYAPNTDRMANLINGCHAAKTSIHKMNGISEKQANGLKH